MRVVPQARYPDAVTVLDDILDGVRLDLAQRQSQVTLEDLKARAHAARPSIDAEAVLRQDGVSVIAEVEEV